MNVIDCIQGSDEWLACRRGIPTASRFSEIVTATGKPTKGKGRRSFALELVAERLTGRAQDHFVSGAMERGTLLEPQARAWYEMASGNAVTQVGFLLADGGGWGASPDGITIAGGIEVKCLGRVNHLDALLNHAVPDDYMMQMQGCMFVAGRSHWDFVLYTDEPGIPSAWWRVERDPAIQAALAECLPVFCEEVDAMQREIERGMA